MGPWGQTNQASFNEMTSSAKKRLSVNKGSNQNNEDLQHFGL